MTLDIATIGEITKNVAKEAAVITMKNINTVNIDSKQIISRPINKKIWIGSYCIDINIR